MAWSGTVSIANSVVLWIMMARTREIDEVGRFAIVMGLYALFVSICSLGLVPYLVSEISRRRLQGPSVKDFISSAAAFMVGAGLVSGMLMTLAGIFTTESASTRLAVFILSFSMLPSGLIILAEAGAVAHGRTHLIARITTTENIARTLVPLFLITQGYGLPLICASFVAVRFLALGAYVLPARDLVSRDSVRGAELLSLARIAPTFAGTIVAASIMWQGPAIFLGRFSSEIETAKYGTASRFMIPVSILLASYADIIQPRLSGYVVSSGAFLAGYIRRITIAPVLIGIAAAMAAPLASGPALRLLFGGTYSEAARTVEIFAACLIPYTLIMIMARALVSLGAQKIDLLANLVGVLTFAILGRILVPSFGAEGAAAAQLIGFILMAAIEVGAIVWLIGTATIPAPAAAGPRSAFDWKLFGIRPLHHKPDAVLEDAG